MVSACLLPGARSFRVAEILAVHERDKEVVGSIDSRLVSLHIKDVPFLLVQSSLPSRFTVLFKKLALLKTFRKELHWFNNSNY